MDRRHVATYQVLLRYDKTVAGFVGCDFYLTVYAPLDKQVSAQR